MEPYERLAEAMRIHALDLGYDWKRLAEKADISEQALRAIRQGESRPRPLTTRRLEAALRWEPGTVKAVYDGRIEPEAVVRVRRSVEDGDERPVTVGVMRRILEVFLAPDAEPADSAREALRVLDAGQREPGKRGR